jgi:hypothetical protein
MYCSKCGYILKKDGNFCEFCGSKVNKIEIVKPEVVEDQNVEKGPFKGFAKAAFPISIVAIVGSFFIIYGLIPILYGFIFSGLGLYSKQENLRAKRALRNCIIASIIQTSIYFLLLLILVIAILD